MRVNAITIGFRRKRRIRAKRTYPAVLDDGNTKIFFDAQANITKDGSNLVSAWNSRIGANHLLQATGTNQMLWSANGVLADGIDNFMKCVAFTWNQPEFIYMVVRQVTWTHNDVIFDGNADVTGMLRQKGLSPDLYVYAGVESTVNSNLAVNTWGIVRILVNGAASKLQVNATAAVTGNFGAFVMAGFTLGCRGGLTVHSNIEVKEIIGRSSALGEAEIYAYLAAKYAAILP